MMPSPPASEDEGQSAYFPIATDSSTHKSEDWANCLPSTEHVQFFRTVDWSSSLLGSLGKWPTALRLRVFTLFADSKPLCIYWGPSKVAIYNEAFVPIAARAHPALMGRPFREVFPERWDIVKVEFKKAEEFEVAAGLKEQELYVERNGFVEETYFASNITPLQDENGRVGGFLDSLHEVTKQKITNRRMAMLNSMSAPSSLERKSFASCVLSHLEKNPRDIPMALLYEIDKESEPGRCWVHRRGSIGVPEGHEFALMDAELASPSQLARVLRKAIAGVRTSPVQGAPELFRGVQWRGFEEPSKIFSTIPILEADRVFGFLVVGTNPRRPIDDDHFQFMQDISMKLSSIASSFTSADEARKRAERREKHLSNDEKQIRFFAEHASVGMQNLSVDGVTVWANEQFYRITGQKRQTEAIEHKLSFIDMVLGEDREKARGAWHRLLKGEKKVQVELRLKKMWTPPSGQPEPVCILSDSFPYFDGGDKPKSIMTCITDISHCKWTESLETRKAEEAREAKLQTDEFIDIVSHEMRNPLSAIFQCADLIQSSVKDCQDKTNPETLLEALHSNVDAAKTISICVKHQKNHC